MKQEPKIAIHLSDTDAEKLKLFMQYYDVFNVLLTAGVFEQKKATIALNFDHNGDLKSIQRADFLYSAAHDKL